MSNHTVQQKLASKSIAKDLPRGQVLALAVVKVKSFPAKPLTHGRMYFQFHGGLPKELLLQKAGALDVHQEDLLVYGHNMVFQMVAFQVVLGDHCFKQLW